MASFNNASNEEAFTAAAGRLAGRVRSARAVQRDALGRRHRAGGPVDGPDQVGQGHGRVGQETGDALADHEEDDRSAGRHGTHRRRVRQLLRKFTGTIDNLATELGRRSSRPSMPPWPWPTTWRPRSPQPSRRRRGPSRPSPAASSSGSTRSASSAQPARHLGAGADPLPRDAHQHDRRPGRAPRERQIVGTWFANNWVNLLRDAFNAATTILTNFGDNIYRLGEAIKKWMENPTKGFQVDFKPLLDGFQATTEKLPELAKPAWVSLQAEMDAVSDRMAGARASGQKTSPRRPRMPPSPPRPSPPPRPRRRRTSRPRSHRPASSP